MVTVSAFLRRGFCRVKTATESSLRNWRVTLDSLFDDDDDDNGANLINGESILLMKQRLLTSRCDGWRIIASVFGVNDDVKEGVRSACRVNFVL